MWSDGGASALSAAIFTGNAGRIMGTVTDQSGGVVSGATVTVIDTDRGVTKTLVTNDAGEYNAPTLNPGTYRFASRPKVSRPSSARTSCWR